MPRAKASLLALLTAALAVALLLLALMAYVMFNDIVRIIR